MHLRQSVTFMHLCQTNLWIMTNHTICLVRHLEIALLFPHCDVCISVNAKLPVYAYAAFVGLLLAWCHFTSLRPSKCTDIHGCVQAPFSDIDYDISWSRQMFLGHVHALGDIFEHYMCAHPALYEYLQ